MTPKERAAMQQALEALELARGSHGVMLMSNPPHDAWQYRGCDSKLAEAITALREALADTRSNIRSPSEHSEQAEQEPVACMNTNGAVNKLREAGWAMNAAPIRTKDLTDEELWEAAKTAKSNDLTDAFRAVIVADREKNRG